jgi:hypothetical protein
MLFAIMKADSKLGRAAAVRDAMLVCMNHRGSPLNAYPAFWAPFSIIGEGATRGSANMGSRETMDSRAFWRRPFKNPARRIGFFPAATLMVNSGLGGLRVRLVPRGATSMRRSGSGDPLCGWPRLQLSDGYGWLLNRRHLRARSWLANPARIGSRGSVRSLQWPWRSMVSALHLRFPSGRAGRGTIL